VVPGDKLVKVEEKLPVPVPFVVLESPVVGEVEVDQQTPLAVTGDPPSDDMLPPLEAVLDVIEVIPVVVNVGITAVVVKLNSLPYEVPTEFVA
jgi:hypothetical protein